MKTHNAWSGVIPFLCVAAAFILGASRGPFYVLGHVDPAYQYLFSSLAILDFTPPRHTDHPGTTLQTLGALVVGLKWLWASWHSTVASLEETVIAHAESYIKAINHVVVMLIGGSMFVAGRRLYRHTQQWLPVFILQCTPVLFVETIVAFYQVSPEPLLVAVVYMLSFLLIPLVVPREEPCERQYNRQAIALGILFGFGMATKVTFFPLLLCVLLLPGWRRRFMTAGITIASFVFFTLPIIKRYKFMVKWNLTVLQHEGIYGEGDVGVPGIGQLLHNGVELFSTQPLLFVLLAIYSLLYAHIRYGQTVDTLLRQHIQRFLAVSIGVIALQLLLTIKHPGGRYLLPSMMFTGLVNGMLVYYYRTQVVVLQSPKRFTQATLLGVLLVMGWNMHLTRAHLHGLHEDTRAARAIAQLTKEQHCIGMGAYITVYKEFALWFADNWNAKRLSPVLDKLHPEALFYEPTNDTFFSFKGPLSREEVEQRLAAQCIYFQTTRRDIFDKNLILEQVRAGKITDKLPLYEFKGFQELPS